MKKILFTTLAFLSIKCITAQNTFPSTGNVGIGTSTPNSLLHVNGASIFENLITAKSGVYISSAGQYISGTGDGNFTFTNSGGGGWWFDWVQNNTTAMRLSSGNNLLIGTTVDGGDRLQVNGDINAKNLKLNSYQGISASCLSSHFYNACGSLGYLTFGFSAISGAETATPDPLTIRQYNNAVGVRNNNPTEALDVYGNVKTTGFILPTNAAAGKVLTSDANGNASWQTASGGSGSWTVSGSDMINSNSGFVGIGVTTNPAPSDAQLKLAVKGNIYTQKLKVTQTTTWADYVFHKNYPLLSLSQLEAYINKHQHPPEVPTTAEVEKNGIDVGDNQVLLLKKVEELTLYLIEQNKKIELLQQQNEDQQKQLNSLKKPNRNKQQINKSE